MQRVPARAVRRSPSPRPRSCWASRGLAPDAVKLPGLDAAGFSSPCYRKSLRIRASSWCAACAEQAEDLTEH